MGFKRAGHSFFFFLDFYNCNPADRSSQQEVCLPAGIFLCGVMVFFSHHLVLLVLILQQSKNLTLYNKDTLKQFDKALTAKKDFLKISYFYTFFNKSLEPFFYNALKNSIAARAICSCSNCLSLSVSTCLFYCDSPQHLLTHRTVLDPFFLIQRQSWSLP